MVNVTVKIDASGIDGAKAVLDDPAKKRALFLQWSRRYSAFCKRRFVKKSQGGDIWPDLAESTKIKRAKKKAARISTKRKEIAQEKAKVKRELKKAKAMVNRAKAKVSKAKKNLKYRLREHKRAEKNLEKAKKWERKALTRKRITRLGQLKAKYGTKIAKTKLAVAKMRVTRGHRNVVRAKWQLRAAKRLAPKLKAGLQHKLQELKKEDLANRKFAILRDTGVLFRALDVGATGNYTEVREFSVVFGFRDAPHGSGTKATIRDIAAAHNSGVRPRLPQRLILEKPDEATIKSMLGDVARAVLKGRQGGNGETS